MLSPAPAGRSLRFGAFEVDLAAGELRKRGVRIKLQEQPFQILVLLLERPGEVVTREELRQKLWPADTYVDFDNSLNAATSKLRQALGDTADSPRFVETLARRGYRFLAPVEGPPAASVPAVTPPELPAVASRPWRVPRRWRGAGALLLLLATLAAVLFGLNPGGWRDRVFGRESIRSLAVLPLENLSRDPEQEYFADGMHDALITNLAKIASLRVISRSSVMHYKRAPKSMPKIGRELQVDALVEGTVLRSGDRVRITAQLIEAATDKHLWAESYEGDLRDVLKLQDDVARAIAYEIRVKLTPQEHARLSGSRRVDPPAYEAYLRGRYHSDKRTLEALSTGIDYFQRAIEKDPGYALPYSGLADAYVLLAVRGFRPPNEVLPQAKIAGMKALQLDPTVAEAHTSLAHAALYERNWSYAEKEFRRAIDLDPGYANARHWYSHYLLAMGRIAESLDESKRALDLAPLDVALAVHLGSHYFWARQYDQALEATHKALEIDPNHHMPLDLLGSIYSEKGMYAEAIEAHQKAITASKGSTRYLAKLGYVYAMAGKRNEAEKTLKELKSLMRRQYVSAYYIAEVYTGLGEKDRALEWLEKAYEESSSDMVYLKIEPHMDRLRSDARFQSLLWRMRL